MAARFSSPRSPVQYHARQNPQPQFVLPTGFRPATQAARTVTGTRVHPDGIPVLNGRPVTFDTNEEVRYVDNPKVDGLGFVGYRVMQLTWQIREGQATSASGDGTVCAKVGVGVTVGVSVGVEVGGGGRMSQTVCRT